MAVPKNKITRAERGKRRQGNKPNIVKDTNNTSVPLHKRGMVAEFLKLMGIASADQTIAKKPPKPKKSKKEEKKPAKKKAASNSKKKTNKSKKK